MKLQEERSGLLYKTRGDASPQGKPKVYFCAHPLDFKLYFEEISKEILKYQDNCAIFYCENGDNSDFSEARQEVLEEMQLFVMPVSADLLTTRNTALEQEFRLAQEKKIPVLPLMQGEGLETLFNEKCGDLQFLDKHQKDATALPYEEKLKKFLESVLIGDEMAEKIRAAFDAYIFLSYRKKDRKEAQKLMRLIHENNDFEDIAIWYDEFLVPGENFNQAIQKALKKCDLFTLLVTPNLVNEPNYVQAHEYPAARKSGKPILPVEARETDRAALEEQYPEIPACAAAEAEELSEEVRSRLTSIALGENSHDPMHLFFMGLAYLGGIDVERNPERAERLLKEAAELDLPEACEKLAAMYNTGEGVERNYATAADWQEKLAALRRELYQNQPTASNGREYFIVLWDLGNDLMAMGQVNRAAAAYGEMHTLCKQIAAQWPDDESLRRSLSVSYAMLGNIALAQDRLEEAQRYYRQALELAEQLAAESEYLEGRRDLSISYTNLGDITKAQGKLVEAQRYYKQSLELAEQLAAETKTLESRRDLSIHYNRLGNIAKAERQLGAAQLYYVQALKLREQIAMETKTVESLRDLSISYEKLGDIAKAWGQLGAAQLYYVQSLELVEQLAAETGTVQLRRDLSINYNNLGDISKAQGRLGDNVKARGRLGEAQRYYRLALEIAEELAAETETVESRRDLSISYEKLGEIAMTQGQLEEAQRYNRKGLEIIEALVNETGTVHDRRSLAISYNRIGDIAKASGKHNEAESWFRKSLEIRNVLADETGTVEDRRRLAISYNRMGNIVKENGEFSEAERWFRKSLEICEALVNETGTVEARSDLAISYGSLYLLADYIGESRKAEKMKDQAIALLEKLTQETDDPQYANMLKKFTGSDRKAEKHTGFFSRPFRRNKK